MPTTSNFDWTTPADTDLVKDGALAIRTLGNGIDTSFLDLKGGTTDQVLAKNSNTDLDFKWVAQDDSNAIQNAIVDAKGDLISATAADTPARLAVGANGTVLTADSAETTGLKWVAPSSGALTLISSTTLTGTASTITFSSIASTYEHLKVIFSATGSDDYIKMTVNGVGTSTHYSQALTLSGTTFTGTEFLGSTVMYVGVKNTMSSGLIDIPNYKRTTIKKTVNAICGRRDGTASNGTRLYNFFATNDATTAISQIDFTSDSVFGIGTTFSLYGVS